MVQENGMMLEVLPLEAGGARLVRVYGQDPCVVLPGSVPAPAGGSWPITCLLYTSDAADEYLFV